MAGRSEPASLTKAMSALPPELDQAVNRAVLARLEGASAHSDIAAVLLESVQPLGDVQPYCPDPEAYRYVVVSTGGVIFGLAVGMDTVAFRLDEKMRERAIATGGSALPECGSEWVAVVGPRPDSDWPAVDVRFWARKAYVHARELMLR